MMTASDWQVRMKKLSVGYDPSKNLELFEGLVTEDTTISTWGEFQDWFAPFKKSGSFRGRRDSTWHLDTSFYRKVHRRWSQDLGATTSETVDTLHPEENELAILRDFQRAGHHHYAVTPDLGQVVDWLALMQHHGAPTRMLD